MEVTLSEDVQPVVPRIGGTLLAAGPKSDSQTVTYSAFDPQSGLAKVEVLLGESVVARRDITPLCHYYDFTVCPAGDEATLSVDTRAVPNGAHPLTLRVYDAAGNQTVVRAPAAVEVANAPPSLPVAIAPASVGTLSVGFGRSTRSSLIVPFVRKVTLRGRLSNPEGQGLDQARVEVLERASANATRQTAVGSAVTARDGRFSYVLASGRRSRIVRVVHRAGGGVLTTSPDLSLRVRAAVSLRARLRGTLVRFSGRVLSRPLPARGKIVKLQGKAPGYGWSRPFVALRTDRRGRFAGRYRLQAHRPGVEVQIRVVVPTERGYAYLSYKGRPIAFKVR